MTRNTEFTDWPGKYGPPPVAPFTHCSPNLLSIQEYLIDELGGAPLGCWGIRDNRAGTAISTHSYAALDWSYRGLGRFAGLDAIARVVENSKELGVQAVHDYVGCRIWRGNRNPAIYPDGWKIQPPDPYGMGQVWADWLHFEVTDTAWFDGRPVLERLAGGVAPPRQRPRLTLGSRGELVVAVQRFLTEHANQGAVIGNIDGIFGPRTRLGWLNFAIWINTAFPGSMTTDGDVNDVDWNVIAWYSGGWGELYAAGFPEGI